MRAIFPSRSKLQNIYIYIHIYSVCDSSFSVIIIFSKRNQSDNEIFIRQKKSNDNIRNANSIIQIYITRFSRYLDNRNGTFVYREYGDGW